MGVDYVIYEKTDPVVDDDAYYGEFLNEYRDVDGIFAITDMFAAKYIERAGRRGIRVPEDVKVIDMTGFRTIRISIRYCQRSDSL